MKIVSAIVLTLVVLFGSPLCLFSFDGTNWNKLSVYEKEAYLLGIYDGILLQKLYGDQYTDHISWKTSNFESARELDKFYSDFKNVNIEVGEAIILFNAKSKGLSEKEIEEIKRLFKTIKSK